MITIDFETYYDTNYSLSKMTTLEYIRDPRFEVIGVGLKINNLPAQWFTGSAIVAQFAKINWAEETIIAHNAAFDAAILSFYYGITPKNIIDTQGLAKATGLGNGVGNSLAALSDRLITLGVPLLPKGDEVATNIGMDLAAFSATRLAEYGAYCMRDCDNCYAIFNYIREHNLMPRHEFAWQSLVIKMYTMPTLSLDLDVLQEELEFVKKTTADLLAKTIYSAKQLGSNETFAKYLEDLGVVAPTKISKVTGKVAYAFAKTDEGMQELLEYDNLEVQSLVAARLGIKSTVAQTRAERLITVHQINSGLLPVPYTIHGAHTGRLSGRDKINLQNLPSGRVKGQSNALRRAIIGAGDTVVVAGDVNAIEPRVLAYMANDKQMLDAFRNKEDSYKLMAVEIFNTPITEITPSQRGIGKAAVLSLGYGSGAEGFRRYCKTVAKQQVEEDFAAAVVATYRMRRTAVVRLWNLCTEALKHMLSGGKGSFGGLDNNFISYDGTRVVGGVVTPSMKVGDAVWVTYAGLNAAQGEKGIEYKYLQQRGRSLVPTKLYGAKVVENLVQSYAFDCIKRMMITLATEYKLRPCMNIHDEIVLTVPETDADIAYAKQALSDVMQRNWVTAGELPLLGEVGANKSYGKC